jgi:PadR family transcriptional regulator, regulatory protein AphA
MPTPNRTEYAILGLLADGPKSGYDIKREVEGPLSHFWHESYGHIYPVLKRLREHGLVTRRRQSRAGRPDRHQYTLTDDGRAEFAEWLRQPVDRAPIRNELLLKVYFGRLAAPGELKRVVAHYCDEQKRAVSLLEGVARAVAAEHGSTAAYPYWSMTIGLGLKAGRAVIEWAEETLRRLETMEET